MSESPSITTVFREARAPSWDDLVRKNYLRGKPAPAAAPKDATKVDVRETAQLDSYEIPVFFNKAIHQPHLENFFNAIRGTAKLNCSGEEAFTSEFIIHKANEAIAARRTIEINAADAVA
jgi:hypothetical protein